MRHAYSLKTAATLVVAAFGLGGCSMGPTELLIVLAIVVLLFGATRLPALGRALGDTVKQFRDSTKKDDKQVEGGDKKDVVRIEDAQVERDEPKKLEDKGSDKA